MVFLSTKMHPNIGVSKLLENDIIPFDFAVV